MNPGTRHPNLALAALTAGTALNPLNSSMIAVALLSLEHDFGVGLAQVTWVITIFYIASVVGQPLMGRVVDAAGPRRTFVAGMAVVLVASVLAPLGGGFVMVCVARGLLAVGTSVAFPAAVALVAPLARASRTAPPRLLARIQITNTAGAALGPVVGGFLVTFSGWQAVFLVNVPLSLLAAAGVLAFAPVDARGGHASARALVGTLDLPGVVAFAVGLSGVLVAVLDAGHGMPWWLLAVGLVALALFVWRERSTRRPFIDVRMLARSRTLTTIYVGFTVFNALFYLAFFGLPQFLEGHGGYSSAVVGLLLLPLAASTLVLAPIAARLISRRGVAPVLAWGAGGLIVAAAMLAIGVATTAPGWMLLMAAAMGVPYCLVSLSMTAALQRAAPPEAIGVASGLLQSTRYLGAIAATVVLGALVGGGVTPAAWGHVAMWATGIGVLHLGVVLAGLRGIRAVEHTPR